jgi:GntR family transcriptional regulator
VIEFQLDETSGVATYLQLVQQVHQALRLGLLVPGDQLPTAQQVVAKLAINPNTVLKAGSGGACPDRCPQWRPTR